MKKIIIAAAILIVLIVLGYLIFSNLVQKSNPCASIFDQTTVSLKEKIRILEIAGAIISVAGVALFFL